MKFELIRFLALVQVQAEDDPDIIEKQRREAQAKESITARHEQSQSLAKDDAGSVEGQVTQPVQRQGPKVGRNEKCPCGSGKKYKQCCGKIS